MAVKECATESVTEYAQLASGCESLFLVTFQEITISSSKEACDGVCF